MYPTVEAADQASDLFQDLCQSGEWPTEAAIFIDYVQNLEEVEVAQLSDNLEYFTVLYRSGVLHVFYCEPEDERSEESGAAVNTYSTGSNPRIFSGFPNQQSPAATAGRFTRVRVQISARQSSKVCGVEELQGIRKQVFKNQLLNGLEAGISMD